MKDSEEYVSEFMKETGTKSHPFFVEEAMPEAVSGYSEDFVEWLIERLNTASKSTVQQQGNAIKPVEKSCLNCFYNNKSTCPNSIRFTCWKPA